MSDLEAENAKLRRVLHLIADDRGRCGACGKDAEGEGGGHVVCEARRGCHWKFGDHVGRARAALGLPPVST